MGYFWVAKNLRRKKNESPPSPLVHQYLFPYIYRPSMETFEVNLVLEY